VTGGHVHIPPPEFDPRQVDDLRRITEQNHRNALGQTRGLGWAVRGIAGIVSWPVRSMVRRTRRDQGASD
jgi:hypothetical protein